MSARKAARRPKAQPKRSRHEVLRESSDGLLWLQRRLYVAKSQVVGAHAVAQKTEDGSDVEEMLGAAVEALESIANEMGNYLPLWIPEEVQS